VRLAVPSRGRLLGVASLSLVLIAPALPAAATSSQPAGSSNPVARKAHQAGGGSKVTVRRDQRGQAHYIGAAAGRVLARNTDPGMSPAAAARQHLDRYAADFGISSPARDLQTDSVEKLAPGQSVVRFQQTEHGLPVLGGQLVSVLDGANNLLSVTGETSTGVRSSTYSVTSRVARAAAVHVTAADHGLGARDLQATAPQQWMYDASLFDSTAAAGSYAVWRLEVTARDRLDVRELVLVDGATGRVVLHVDEIERAAFNAHRAVCNNHGKRNDDYRCERGRYVRTEGGASTGIADVDAAYNNAGAASTFYEGLGLNLTALIGSDYGDGKRLRSTVRVCPSNGGGPCPYANAFWDGFQMVYGAGFSRADDVVGHELTHGVTQHTNGLVYWFESGAINESMSDVFGEFIDKSEGTDDDSAWDLGEDLPGPVVRSMKNPPLFDQPDRVGGPNWTDGRDRFGAVDSGGVHTNSGVGNKAAYLITDGTSGEPGGMFNTRTFSGLGVAKAKWIYWGAENLLTPGSDYADLANALFAACSALSGGPTGIVAADCDNVVTPATLATEMLPATAPSVPQSVTIIGSYHEIRVRWSPPATGNSSVNSYVVTVKPAIQGENFLAIDDPRARDVTIGDIPAGRTFHFALIAVSSVGNSPPSPPITLRGTKLSLSTESSVPYKKRAHLTAQLSLSGGGGIANRSISLYRKVDGKPGYRKLNTKKTNGGGAVTFNPHQKHPSTYFATFAANSTIMLGSRSSKHLVARGHRVSLHADHLSVHAGHAVHFSGRVRPADRSTVIVLRRPVSGGSWTPFAVAAVSSTGHYRLTWTPVSGRDFEWRVKVKRSPDFVRGVSRTRVVRVT
jgi:bacillolysin